MDMSSCSPNGLLSQPFTGGNTTSLYACAFASNASRAATCCSPDTPHPFSDPCYSWCDLPASMNSQFDTGEVDFYQYFHGCLNATGEKVTMLWCHAQPHVVASSNPSAATATTTSATPTGTFNNTQFCATADPQSAIAGPVDSGPGCGILPNTTNTDQLERCCQPAAVKYSVAHCYEYCALPRGNGFRGAGNLSYDEALGSFKACMLQQGNGNQSVLDGVFCRVNGSAVDITGTFGTTKYLTGAAGRIRIFDCVLGLVVAIVAIMML